MSIGKINNLACYSNLSTGGAQEMYKLHLKFFKTKTKVIRITDFEIRPKNLFNYLYVCMLVLPKLHKLIAANLQNKTRILIGYHSWLTKSPHIFRYLSGPKIYVCQEVMREYYDPLHIANQNIKERIINFIRLPIKIIDSNNLKSQNLTVIANSNFSKAMIDKAYNVSSKVIYPGIDTSLFKINGTIEKKNQIISVGAINKLKGYEFIVRVISKINKEHRPKFIIIGNGAENHYLSFLRDLAIKLDVKIEINVNITKTKLVKKYHQSRLFIYAPLNEPFGLAIEEAMASGLPLIAYKYGGGYAEILDDRNGLIIDNLNAGYWASQVEKLLMNQNLQTKYANYNNTYVRSNFDQKKMNENLWKVIKNL